MTDRQAACDVFGRNRAGCPRHREDWRAAEAATSVGCDVMDRVHCWSFELARPERAIRLRRDREFVLCGLPTVDGRHGGSEVLSERPRDA